MGKLQKTIKEPVKISGIGLHTGGKVNLLFKPAPINSGINFVRMDLPDRPTIKADYNYIVSQAISGRRTSVGIKDAEIQTIEHLMAALCGLEIDNLIIEIDNGEVPGLDGSGLGFLEAIEKAGIVEQESMRKFFSIKEPVWVIEDKSIIVALPDNEYSVGYTLEYNHPLLKSQYLQLAIDRESFKKEIASSRTFCLENEAGDLQGKGLGKGANYQNTLVVGDKGVVNNSLRFNDEFVRHKILDLIGDLYLLGVPLKARVLAVRSGHSLNLKLVKKIQQQKMKTQGAGIPSGGANIEGGELDSSLIMKILPHRYPFLLVDKIISLEEGKRAVGIKNVTINENFFCGHFPGRPIMPGVLIIEAMAQVGGVMMLAPQENRGKLAYFLAADKVKFRRTVVPGDQLVIEVEATKIKAKTGQIKARVSVSGKVATEGELMFALVEE